mgnify:FL=1
MMQRYAVHAPILVGLGYDTTPLVGKKPILEGWQKRPDAALDFHKYNGNNIGVLTGGKSHVVAVDVDVYDHRIAQQFEEVITEELGFAPQRIGMAPKALFVFRCTEAVPKMRTAVFHIKGKDSAIEILAEGQQFVASGIHPDTKKKYKWVDDTLADIPVDKLTAVTPDQLREFVAMSNTMLSKHGKPRGRAANGSPQQMDWFATQELTGEVKEIDVALAHIPNDDWHYEDWVRMAMSLKGAVADEGYELWHRFSQRSEKYDRDETDRVWKSIKDVRRVGAGSIFYMARDYGFDVGEFRRKEQKPTEPPKAVIEVDEDTGLPQGMYRASEVSGPVPERQWLLNQWFPKRAVSLLFGQGGVGKTLIVQQLANAVADGEAFMGIGTSKMPVLCVLCEDDKQEIDRRQIDINGSRGIDDAFGSAPDNVYLWPRVGEDNIVVTFPNAGEDQPTSFYADLVKAVEAAKGDADEICVILDNATDFFGGGENVRREVNSFIKTYCGSLCTKHNATVILLAHPSLSGLASGSGMSGSTAWENSVRSRAYLSRDADMDEVRTLSRKKSNYSAVDNETDIKLIWEAGVLTLPTSDDAIARIEGRNVKRAVLDAVDEAQNTGSPFKSRTGRTVRNALPKVVNKWKRGVVMKAFYDLESDGCIVHEARKGYRVNNRPNWS